MQLNMFLMFHGGFEVEPQWYTAVKFGSIVVCSAVTVLTLAVVRAYWKAETTRRAHVGTAAAAMILACWQMVGGFMVYYWNYYPVWATFTSYLTFALVLFSLRAVWVYRNSKRE